MNVALENWRYLTLRQNWAQNGNSNRPTTDSPFGFPWNRIRAIDGF